ncbi:caspase family protein [Dyadobacter psychrotolerans]|uniref:Caspase family protein n=1 Tax=Dyadobacter psychrotolerans TaxID=2541721 RepID=A0A4R5DA25_9BACT|nr:caspase family protein [Dyadobacter psychrotolerans]TDE08294.1 caspase family protein [Dyadobacter psychrotolerans]
MKFFNFSFLFLFSQACFAQTTYAVIVGISDYEILDYRTGDLKYADKDAIRFMDFLKSPLGGNVPNQNMVSLPNKRATKNNMSEAMRIFQKAGPYDRVIFYFSGHGVESAFVPYDVKQKDPSSLLTHADVKKAFKASKATTKLIIADACMSGSMKSKKPPVSMAKAVKEFNDINVAMILSSRSSQSSVETIRVKGGLFTFYLLNGLQGKADKNQDKKVTIKELFTYVSPRVKKGASNGQAPVFAGKFSDDLVLSLIP